jgi:hypothetical protein
MELVTALSGGIVGTTALTSGETLKAIRPLETGT